ncbi:hypothetical protein [Halocatena pleomorpha]|nr:hypothetical protein [Halocatena pleomorpha]
MDSGEPVAIEGTLTVETPADGADLLASDSEQVIGGSSGVLATPMIR